MNDCGFLRDALLNASRLVEGSLFILCVLSAWMLGHAVDCTITFRRAKGQSKEFTDRMEALLKRDEWESAFALGEALTRSCVPVVWSRGLREFQKSCNRVSVQNAIDGAIRAAEIAKNEKRVQLRRGLNGLSAISITAPFVGLFGSCVGILDSFRGYAGN